MKDAPEGMDIPAERRDWAWRDLSAKLVCKYYQLWKVRASRNARASGGSLIGHRKWQEA